MTSVYASANGASTSANADSANHGLVGNALQLLAVGLGPYVASSLREAAGMGRYVPNDVDTTGDVAGDVSLMLKVMATGWNEVFRDHLGPIERSLVSEIRETRNRWAHQEPFDDDDLDRALDSIGRLLKAVSAGAEAERVHEAKHRLRRKRYATETPATSRQAPTTAVHHTPAVKAGDKTDSLIQRGIVYRQEGDFEKAIADFEEAIGANRESAEAWYQRALTWGHMKEYQRAINDFNRAITLDQDYAAAYADRGYAQFCLGDYTSAVHDFESAIHLNPDDDLARANLDKARRRGKEMREAQSRLR